MGLPFSSSPALGSQAYTTMSGCLCELLTYELTGSILLTQPSLQPSLLCHILSWVRVSDMDEQSEQMGSIQVEYQLGGLFAASSLLAYLWTPGGLPEYSGCSRALQLGSPEKDVTYIMRQLSSWGKCTSVLCR